MSDDQNLPSDEEQLKALYQSTIQHHHQFLEKVQTAFDNRCDEIGASTKEKLAEIDEEDEEVKQQIMEEEKALLNKTLSELKFTINKSNSNALKKLEEIQNKLDNSVFNLDQALKEVE